MILARLVKVSWQAWPIFGPANRSQCRPIVGQTLALPVLTPTSHGLSRPCRPFMFFAFPCQFWPRPTAARPGRAGPVAGASPVFLSPDQHGQSPATSLAHPDFQSRLWPRSTPVWPGSWCKGVISRSAGPATVIADTFSGHSLDLWGISSPNSIVVMGCNSWHNNL